MKRADFTRLGSFSLSALFALSLVTPVLADTVTLKKGTDVKLAFDSSLDSTKAKPGDHVTLHVIEPVEVDGKTVIADGTKVSATVQKVKKRAHFGTNANIQLFVDPIKTVAGKTVPVGFHSKSGDLSRPGTAAGASVGTAALLGPLGLAAGYFIVGKKIHLKPGDKTTVNTDDDVSVKVP